MANYDATTAAAQAASGYKTYTSHVVPEVIRKVFSFADLAALKGSAVASGDTYDLVGISAGDLIVGTALRVITPDGSASTLALGDQSAASFQAATALNAAANTYVAGSGAYLQNAASPYNVYGGKFYAAANTVRATLGGTVGTAAVFELLVFKVSLGTSTTV